MSETASVPDSQVLVEIASKLARYYPGSPTSPLVLVDVRLQRLFALGQDGQVASYAVSTGADGIGQCNGTCQTPVGVFRVAEKFGEGAPAGRIFRGRRDTGADAPIRYEPDAVPGADLVTTRILWLDGLQRGFNLGGEVDTRSRYIYIHGTPEEGRIGKPVSHGCVRMRNTEVIELYDRVPVGTLVCILPGDRPWTDIPGPLPKFAAEGELV